MSREHDSISQAWRERAEELAQWTVDALVNRHDLWGRYLPLNQRTGQRVSTTARGLLNRTLIAQHYRAQDPGHLIGLHAISPRNTCRWFAIGVDRGGPDDATTAEDTRFAALRWNHQLQELGFFPLLEDRNGAGGYILWVLLDRPAPSREVHAFAQRLVHDYRWGLETPPETFPNQAGAEAARVGNWLGLPGCHHTLAHWSKVWSGVDWLSGAAAVETFLRVPPSASALFQTQGPEPAEPSMPPAAPRPRPASAAPSLSGSLRAAVRESGLGLDTLSAATGVALDSLLHFVAGDSDLDLESAGRLAAFLGLELRKRVE